MVPLLVCAGCGVIGLAIVLVGVMSNLLLSANNKQIQATIDEKKPVVEIYNNYLTQKVIHDGMIAMENVSNVANDKFLDFLAEMEKRIPSDMLVDNLGISADSISLSLSCHSKESAAEAIMQLRQFDTVYNVMCTGISEDKDDAGVTKVSFQVTVTYKPVEAQDTEQTAEGEQAAATETQTQE